jgi:hypothetical protein
MTPLARPLVTLAVLGALAARPASAQRLAPDGGFVENRGQWPAEVLAHRGNGPLGLWVTGDELVLEMRGERHEAGGAARGVALGLGMEGSQPPTVLGEGRDLGRRDYRHGPDPAAWALDAPAHERLRLRGLWPGVDLLLRPGRAPGERVAFDLELEPGASLAGAVFHVRGASGLRLEEEGPEGDGRLVLETELGPVVLEAPVSWTVLPGGERRPHPVRFRRLDPERFGFEAPPAPEGAALVVDPGVVWSTYLGDTDEDRVHALAPHPGGLVITGTTRSPLFPRVRGSYDIDKAAGYDAFVTWLRADIGWPVRSSFLGGAGDDLGEGLAVDAGGEVWVGGATGSPDLPVTAGAHDATHGGGWDGFLARFSAGGDQLLACTYLGASGDDLVTDLELDAQGRPVVCGRTGSPAFPAVGGFDTTFGGGVFGGGDAFVARLDRGLGTLERSTFLGGTANDGATRLACAADGGVVVVGWTGSTGFPVTPGVVDPQLGGAGTLQDGFASRLDQDLAQLTWSTFLGGGGRDEALGVHLEASGEAWVVGATASTDFPLGPGPLQASQAGLDDGFFLRLAADAGALLVGSYLGGSERDGLHAVAGLPGGGVVAVGGSASADLAVLPGAYDPVHSSWPGSGTRDALVVTLDGAGQVVYSTFVGGQDDEVALDVAPDGGGGALLAGWTTSFDYPSASGFDTSYDLSLLPDGFLTRLEFQEYPFRYGAAKPNSVGGLAQMTYVGFPSLATDDFVVLGDGAVPNTTVMFVWSHSPAATPFQGGLLLLGPPHHRTPIQQVSWFGSAELPVPIDASMVGTRRYYQYWYHDPGDPFGSGLSDGLEVLFHP